MKKRFLALLMAAVMVLALCACKNDSPLSAAQIQKIALADAGLKAAQVADLHTHVVTDYDVPAYSIHFTHGDAEYSYVIDAYTGEILDFSDSLTH